MSYLKFSVFKAKHPELDLDILDLRTLAPLDTEAIYESVRKTGKVIVLHEDCLTGGIGGELVSIINENSKKNLRNPKYPISKWPKFQISNIHNISVRGRTQM